MLFLEIRRLALKLAAVRNFADAWVGDFDGLQVGGCGLPRPGVRVAELLAKAALEGGGFAAFEGGEVAFDEELTLLVAVVGGQRRGGLGGFVPRLELRDEPLQRLAEKPGIAALYAGADGAV